MIIATSLVFYQRQKNKQVRLNRCRIKLRYKNEDVDNWRKAARKNRLSYTGLYYTVLPSKCWKTGRLLAVHIGRHEVSYRVSSTVVHAFCLGGVTVRCQIQDPQVVRSTYGLVPVKWLRVRSCLRAGKKTSSLGVSLSPTPMSILSSIFLG